MALKPLFSGNQPCMFDGYDSNVLSLLGGELVRLTEVAYSYPPGTSADKAAFDSYLSEVSTSQKTRTVVTSSMPSTTGTYRPLFLADEGTSGYGVMLGVVVGSFVGQTTSGTNLGPHTATGSGKVTCWDKPGLYAVTLDAVEATIVASGALNPGDALFVNTSGKLTGTEANGFDFPAGAGSTTIVGRFVEFSTGGSLVTTPSWMVGATSAVMPTSALTQMVFHFRIEN